MKIDKIGKVSTWKVTVLGILGLLGFRMFWELVGKYIEEFSNTQLGLGLTLIFLFMLVVQDKNIFAK